MREYRYRRGEDIVLGALIEQGDPDQIASIGAALKRAVNRQVPPESAPVIATFSASFTPAAGEVAAHWLLTIFAADSEEIAAGIYVTTPRIELVDGGVEKLDPIFIVIGEATS